MTRDLFPRIVFALALSPLVAGCGLLKVFTGPGDFDIEYRVSGTAPRVSLRYQTESGTSEESNVALPWTFTRKAEDDDELYISAQITEGDGTVTVAIYKTGKLLHSSTSTGTGATAIASGTLE